jgi:ABC-type nitrate/sulfonate/bicarbonate transport system substrate-binding protein
MNARLQWAGLVTAAVLTIGATGDARAQALTKLDVLVFSPPSLSAFLPPIIKAQKFDQANGLDLSFPERTPDAYSTQFNSGEFQVGGAGTLQLIGNADTKGVKVRYLFNIFDYWGAVVTSRDNIRTLKDLEGKEIAAARATTNYQMFEFFAKQQGVDVSKFKVINTATAGLVSYAIADRADAIQLWEPAYTLLKSKKPGIRTLDMGVEKVWKDFAKASSRIPYLGVAAHAEWVDAHPDLIKKLYATYKAAAEWTQKHPDEAAPLMFPKSPPADQKEIASLIRANDRLGISLAGATEIRREIEAVYKAGVALGYLSKMPSEASIYDKPVQ